MTGRSTKNVLQPGEVGTVEIGVDTQRFRGTITKTCYVVIENGKTFREVRLWVAANSREDVAFSQKLDFAKIKRGETPTTRMKATFLGHPKLQVTEAKCDSSFIGVKLQELERGATQTIYQVSATVRADIPEGTWFTDVQLSTNNPDMPKLAVPLTVEVEPAPEQASPEGARKWFRLGRRFALPSEGR